MSMNSCVDGFPQGWVENPGEEELTMPQRSLNALFHHWLPPGGRVESENMIKAPSSKGSLLGLKWIRTCHAMIVPQRETQWK